MKRVFNLLLKITVLLHLLTFCFVFSSIASGYITVATIGAAPSYEKGQGPQANVNRAIEFWKRELEQVLPDKPDLIVLPEFCDLSGAGEEYLKIRKDQIFDYFASVAKGNNCYIAFGTKRLDNNNIWRNSCILINREGETAGIYDKNFPTIGEMEDGTKAGNEARVIQCDFGKVAIVICFDLNFNELLQNYAEQKPDLILFSSMYHGGSAQSVWAYTCRSYFVGSVYKGAPSEIRNPFGEVIASSTNYYNYAVARINMDYKLAHLDFNRSRFAALKKKYGPYADIYEPGKIGYVQISSEHENISAAQMVEEFEIELLDDYFDRSRNFRLKNENLK